jgi:hypothetical protein
MNDPWLEEVEMRKWGDFVHRDSPFKTLRVICAVSIGLLGLLERTEAQGTSPIAIPSTEFSFGMVGLAPGETARLNVVNVGVATGTPLPCVLALAFFDSNSKILKQTFVSLKSGQSASLDLAGNEAGASAQNGHKTDSAQRVSIRGAGYNPLLAAGSAIPQPLSCNLVPTLELFDADTGRTVAILGDFTRPGASVSPPVATQP